MAGIGRVASHIAFHAAVGLRCPVRPFAHVVPLGAAANFHSVAEGWDRIADRANSPVDGYKGARGSVGVAVTPYSPDGNNDKRAGFHAFFRP